MKQGRLDLEALEEEFGAVHLVNAPRLCAKNSHHQDSI